MYKKCSLLVLLLLTLSLLSGCAVTTRSLEGTSETVANTTEALVDLTSSTFPRSDEAGASDVATKAERRKIAIKFASFNYEKIRRDASRGEGEYLETLGDLMVTNPATPQQFSKFLKENYETIFMDEIPTEQQSQGLVLVTKIEDVMQNNS